MALGAVLLFRGPLGKHDRAAEPAPPPSTATASTTASASPTPRATPRPKSTAARPVPVQRGMSPSSIHIPALGVTARIGTADVVNGELIPPMQPDVVGMWGGSAGLDEASGEVTLAGHINWSGLGPFAFGRLAELHRGDLVYTTDGANRQTAWRIASVTARSKSLPIDVTAFAGHTGTRKLALISCGGTFIASAHSYDSNIYVFATPVRTP